MGTLVKTCVVLGAVLAMAGLALANNVPGWDAFVVRDSSTSPYAAPVISDVVGGKLFGIVEGGQKAGWGTNNMNGWKMGDIQSISITRDPATTGSGPYMNFWVTDGVGGYAVLALPAGVYNTTWAGLKTQTAYVYETGIGFTTPFAGNLLGDFTFNDFAGYTIATPPSHWGGTGAPDDLNASQYTAYGFNWVFGDTQSNFLGGYLASNPVAIAVPEPVTMLGLIAGVGGVAGYLRRRRAAQ